MLCYWTLIHHCTSDIHRRAINLKWWSAKHWHMRHFIWSLCYFTRKRRFQNPLKYLLENWFFFLRKQLTALWTCFAKIVNGWRLLTIFAKKLHKAFNFFCKALHLRGLTGFLMRLCKDKQQNARDFLS